MLNIIIYLKKEYNAKDLVKILLEEKLIASATIDENNVSYEMGSDGLDEKVYTVITSQSRALLFNDIVEFVENMYGHEIPINGIPIVSTNTFFNIQLKTKTITV